MDRLASRRARMVMTMISLPLLQNTLNTPSPPQQQPARSGSHRNGDTPAAQKKRVGPIDGPPKPIWPIVGPPKLAPKGGPGPGGQSKGTWTLVFARPHGAETKFQKSAQIIVPGVGWLPAAVQPHCDVRGVGGWQSQYPEPTQVETTVVAETTGREG